MLSQLSLFALSLVRTSDRRLGISAPQGNTIDASVPVAADATYVKEDFQ
jgi:hypothetical protein